MSYFLWMIACAGLALLVGLPTDSQIFAAVTFGVSLMFGTVMFGLEQDKKYPVVFRDQHDAVHFYGAAILMVALTLLFSIWHLWVEAAILAYIATNLLGIILELLQWKVLKHYKDPYFIGKSRLFVWIFSGDKLFDLYDCKMNLLGATLIMPFFHAITHNRITGK